MSSDSYARSPNKKKIKLTWSHVEKLLLKPLINKLKNYKFDEIFAVSRGGLIPGVYLSHVFKKPLRVIEPWQTPSIRRHTLIIDDVVDTDYTYEHIMSEIIQHHDKITFAALVKKPWSKANVVYGTVMNEWVVFPWEQ
ncbi:MAG: hypothetical protein DRP85_00910 [Candidatus Makaraimicrobium thalassicum]|nr:MAG: hypothetical protein DRP85_00910 [Candidatus Omnitrophota bacterium]